MNPDSHAPLIPALAFGWAPSPCRGRGRGFIVLPRSLYFLLFLLIPGSQLQAQENRSSPSDQNVFGVVEAFWLPDVACQLHPGWERIIFDWSQHQPGGPDDWNTLNVDDRWLQAA